MNTLSSDIQNRLLRLKETFDRAIAKPIASKPGNRTQYLVFKLEQEYFAWPAANLEEIILNRRIVALPCRQERFYGIVNYKNDVLPVISLHSHLNFASEKPQKGRILLIKENGGYTICQDESTSIVFGMPKAAIEIGAAREILPDGQIVTRIMALTANCRRMGK